MTKYRRKGCSLSRALQTCGTEEAVCNARDTALYDITAIYEDGLYVQIVEIAVFSKIPVIHVIRVYSVIIGR